ncbi:MAG: hypothetical protein AAFR93_02890 [Pseudomonadota bacterium]
MSERPGVRAPDFPTPDVLLISPNAFLRRKIMRDLAPTPVEWHEVEDPEAAFELEVFTTCRAIVVAQVAGVPDPVALQTLVAAASCPVFLWTSAARQAPANLPQQIQVLGSTASHESAQPLRRVLAAKGAARRAEDVLHPTRHTLLRSEEMVERCVERLAEVRRCLKRRDIQSARMILVMITADLAEIWAMTH